MFIPNKTFQTIRVVILGVIAILLLAIAGQSVLYIQSVNKNKVMLDSMATHIEAVSSDAKTNMSVVLKKTNNDVSQIKTKVDKLLRNECSAEAAAQMLTKEMVIVCQNLGLIP